MYVLIMSWSNQVSYSEGDEVFVFADRPSAVAKIRETLTDAGLDYGQDWEDQDPDFVDDNGPTNDGYLGVDYEGKVIYKIVGVEMELPQAMLFAADACEAASRIYKALNPAWSPWTAAQLRNESKHVDRYAAGFQPSR